MFVTDTFFFEKRHNLHNPRMTLLQLTSCALFAASIASYQLEFYLDAALLAVQGVMALIYHTTYSPFWLKLDRAALLLLVVRGFLLAIRNSIVLILFTAGSCLMTRIYVYGWLYTCYSFDPCKTKADRYHSTMHTIVPLLYVVSLRYLYATSLQ